MIVIANEKDKILKTIDKDSLEEAKDDILKFINGYLKEINFKSYYCRYWIDIDDWLWMDYGSHTHFIKYKVVNELDLKTQENMEEKKDEKESI